jgi:hypothetical protein
VLFYFHIKRNCISSHQIGLIWLSRCIAQNLESFYFAYNFKIIPWRRWKIQPKDHMSILFLMLQLIDRYYFGKEEGWGGE